MNEGTHEELLNLVGPKLQKQDTQMCNAISSNQCLSVILHYLATDKSFSVIKFLSFISKRALGHIVMETCGWIIKILKCNVLLLSCNCHKKSS